MRVFLTFILAVFLTACATQSKQVGQKHNHENKRSKDSIFSLVGSSQKHTKKRGIASSEQCPDLSGTYQYGRDEFDIKYEKRGGVAYYTLGEKQNIVADGKYRAGRDNREEDRHAEELDVGDPIWELWEGFLAFCNDNILFVAELSVLRPEPVRSFRGHAGASASDGVMVVSLKKLSTGIIQMTEIGYNSRSVRYSNVAEPSSEQSWLSWVQDEPIKYDIKMLHPKN